MADLARIARIAFLSSSGVPLREVGALPEAEGSAAARVGREHDLLDLVALSDAFPEALASSYAAIGANTDRRRAYLDMLTGFQHIEGRKPAEVEPQIARLVDTLLSNADLRAPATGPPGPAEQTGPTLEHLLPDPAQHEVLRRTLTALDVLS